MSDLHAARKALLRLLELHPAPAMGIREFAPDTPPSATRAYLRDIELYLDSQVAAEPRINSFPPIDFKDKFAGRRFSVQGVGKLSPEDAKMMGEFVAAVQGPQSDESVTTAAMRELDDTIRTNPGWWPPERRARGDWQGHESLMQNHLDTELGVQVSLTGSPVDPVCGVFDPVNMFRPFHNDTNANRSVTTADSEITGNNPTSVIVDDLPRITVYSSSPPPGYAMTSKARRNGGEKVYYDQFITAGWTKDELLKYGYMVATRDEPGDAFTKAMGGTYEL